MIDESNLTVDELYDLTAARMKASALRERRTKLAIQLFAQSGVNLGSPMCFPLHEPTNIWETEINNAFKFVDLFLAAEGK